MRAVEGRHAAAALEYCSAVGFGVRFRPDASLARVDVGAGIAGGAGAFGLGEDGAAVRAAVGGRGYASRRRLSLLIKEGGCSDDVSASDGGERGGKSC